MQPKPKANSVLTHTVDMARGIITYHVLGAGQCVFNYKKATPENREFAEVHGWIQRGSDRAAIGRDPTTGKSATPEQKLQAIVTWRDHVEGGGAWSMVAEGEARPNNMTVRALAQCLKTDVQSALERAQQQAEAKGITVQALLAKYRSTKGPVRDAFLAIRDAEGPDSTEGEELLASV